MRNLRTGILLIFCLGRLCWSLENTSERVRVEKIRDDFFKIICSADYDVNLLAFTGRDGILLVDTGFRQTAEELIKTVKSLGDGKIRFVINTHEDGDHIGGNTLLDAATVIIAHPNARKTIGGGYFELEPFRTKGVPQIATDGELRLFFNGEEVRIKHFQAAHTTGDLIVHFVKSKIVHVGDMVFSGSYAGFHVQTGGDARGYFEFQKKLIDYLPADVRIIAGHGREDLTKAGLEHYYRSMRKGVETIMEEFQSGRDTDEIVNSPAVAEWRAMDGKFYPFRDWINEIRKQYLKEIGKNKSLSEAMVHEYVQNGLDAAVAVCRKLRSESAGEYLLAEQDLNAFGYQLLERKNIQEAIQVFRLNVEFYPESGNVYDSLAEAYLNAGDRAKAIEFYVKSLEKDPSNSNARDMLQKLGYKKAC